MSAFYGQAASRALSCDASVLDRSVADAGARGRALRGGGTALRGVDAGSAMGTGSAGDSGEPQESRRASSTATQPGPRPGGAGNAAAQPGVLPSRAICQDAPRRRAPGVLTYPRGP